ncbi:MAG: hypothetical protein NVV67_03520 [Pseudoxanthomonas sp.]|nr:hypothetical protein [Pseudoxanthomonas sp.]
MGKDLGPLAWGIAKASSTSLALVAEKYGSDRATRVMAAEIQELVPMYIERWEEALSDAYAKQLSTEELNSVADLGVKSPHYQKLLSVQAAVGQEMRQTGKPIVEDLVAAAFKNAIADAP